MLLRCAVGPGGLSKAQTSGTSRGQPGKEGDRAFRADPYTNRSLLGAEWRTAWPGTLR